MNRRIEIYAGVLVVFFYIILFCPKKAFAVEQDVIVSEVMYDFQGRDSDHEWIELYNNGNDPVTIIGGLGNDSWRINDGDNHTFSSPTAQGSLTLQPSSFAVIAKNTTTFLSDYPGFSGTLIQSSISLGNTSATVGLKIGSSGSMWGEFSYDSTLGGNGDGNSLQKKADGIIIAALPNPGATNATSPAPTSTSTPSPTVVPADTPTPSKTPTPTKTPTPNPTTTSIPTPTVLPTLEPILSSDEKKQASNSVDLAVLGERDSEPSKSGKILVESSTNKKKNNNAPFFLISGGILFLSACGILSFYLYKKGS